MSIRLVHLWSQYIQDCIRAANDVWTRRFNAVWSICFYDDVDRALPAIYRETEKKKSKFELVSYQTDNNDKNSFEIIKIMNSSHSYGAGWRARIICIIIVCVWYVAIFSSFAIIFAPTFWVRMMSKRRNIETKSKNKSNECRMQSLDPARHRSMIIWVSNKTNPAITMRPMYNWAYDQREKQATLENRSRKGKKRGR